MTPRQLIAGIARLQQRWRRREPRVRIVLDVYRPVGRRAVVLKCH